MRGSTRAEENESAKEESMKAKVTRFSVRVKNVLRMRLLGKAAFLSKALYFKNKAIR